MKNVEWDFGSLNIIYFSVTLTFILISLNFIRDLYEEDRRQNLLQTQHQLRESQQIISQAQKMESIGRFAGNLSHDFNQMLTVIIGNCDILLHRIEDDDLKNSINEIKSVAEKSVNLIGQLLLFSKQQPFLSVVIDINDMIRESSKLLHAVVGKKINLKIDLCSRKLTIRIEKGKLEQLLFNLIFNAQDAIVNDGEIVIKTEYLENYKQLNQFENGAARISVADNGIGIHENIISHLYEPYFSTKKDGSGLGLSIVYGIVQQNNGIIELDTEPGKFTRFDIYFPIVEETTDETEKVDIDDKQHLKQPPTQRILLVDDNNAVRKAVLKMLRSSGYDVVDATSGFEAIELIDEYDFDILITDIKMPDMSGLELGTEVHRRGKDVKILYISGYADFTQQEYETITRDNFLRKPFTIDELQHKLLEL